MREKAERLGQSRFTIALFGAFSAGKSSFANALIGERILPVSPNPTTAAINKIMPPEPEAGWPHGTAKIRMKSAERLASDVLYSLEVLGFPASDMTEALQVIARLRADQIPGKGKPHYSFLKAVEKGWSEQSAYLGQERKASLEQFREYAAEEAKSCFVELIELYYMNPLTEQGVVLVDTPGADSINARHTGVAFEYIKNADAILFVTYYNHAFSHADREFLLQLGRVKDSFELDKMFFIVNAADLASSAEELSGVVAHVESNLVQHGIRKPRIYPLSSYYALEGKVDQNETLTAQSGITQFEQEFIRFTFEELTELVIKAGEADMRRAMEVLKRWIASAQSDESERRREAEQLRADVQLSLSSLQGSDPSAERRELTKEIEELLYYVRQRTSYRFGEFFGHSFNPAVFREEGKDAKALLQGAWEELKRMITFDLSQEVLATTLRIENKINKLMDLAVQEWTAAIRTRINSFDPPSQPALKLETPELKASLQADEVTVKWLQSFYKNPKQFFEGDGRQSLRKELEAKLVRPMSEFAEAQAAQLVRAYQDQLEAAYRSRSSFLTEALQEHADGLLAALEQPIDLPSLQSKQSRLHDLIES
ncbi:dynamin family protein [Paenibacillus silviterrae]|uniref:dynamin family protein n=1 Tax=Paenibacillus silviterrae TaxID=3242194 RepID=UPI0025427668|nr:dynamin family protein [Paenibacillus chinjuensis]